MKQAYPVLFMQGKTQLIAYVPDFDINTQGTDLPEAIAMARDCIGLMGLDMQDSGEKIPAPSEASSISPAPGELLSMVDVDFAAYRRAQEERAVRRNVTLPSWLNEAGERANINFSQVLQEGLKSRLHVDRP